MIPELKEFYNGDKLNYLQALKYLDHNYWSNNTTIVPDSIYDALVNEFQELDPTNDYFKKLPTDGGNNKVKHLNPMLSLQKKYSTEEVIVWCKSVSRDINERFEVSLKLDGISAVHNNGKLATRGDGQYGEDISDKLPYIMTLSKEPLPKLCKGELIIHQIDFDRYKSEYANPRNMVAGLMNNKDPSVLQGKNITFMDYEFIQSAPTTINEIESIINKIMNNRDKLTFPIDGIVIRLADKEYSSSLGYGTSTYNHAIAMKFQNKSTTTILESVDWQLSRTGKLSPVANLKPVPLDGVVISNALIHNPQVIEKLQIGIGSEVILERAGQVIPKIVGAKTPGIKIELPTHCPFCKQATIKVDRPNGYDIVCNNISCNEKNNQIVEFVGRLFDIKTLGGAAAKGISKLIGNNDYLIINKLIGLTVSDLMGIEGFQVSKSNTLYNNIQNQLKSIHPATFLASLGIEGIGETLFTKILKSINIDKLIDEGIKDRVGLEGVGEITAKAINDGLLKHEIKEYYDSIKHLLQEVEIESNSKQIYFSGKLPFSKKVGASIAHTHGFAMGSGVNKETVLLVCDETGTANFKKAQKFGIQIMTSDEFLQEYQ